jgi:hypothetical protein
MFRNIPALFLFLVLISVSEIRLMDAAVSVVQNEAVYVWGGGLRETRMEGREYVCV